MDEALNHYHKAIRADKSYFYAYESIAYIYFRHAQYEKALSYYTHPNIDSNKRQYIKANVLIKVICLYFLEQYEESLAIIEDRLLKKNNFFLNVTYLLTALNHSALQQQEIANIYYQKSLDTSPSKDKAEYLQFQINNLIELRQYDKTIALLKSLASTDSNRDFVANHHKLLAPLHFLQKDFISSSDYYKKISNIGQMSREEIYYYASSLFHREQYQESMNAFKPLLVNLDIIDEYRYSALMLSAIASARIGQAPDTWRKFIHDAIMTWANVKIPSSS